MARLARVVVPGLPHHVTQRGNGRARTFFGDDDYRLYRSLLAEACAQAAVEVWAWVLMPNHVHLILTPSDPDGLRRALAPTHRRYAGRIHARQQLTGHFLQGRFGAMVMDEDHLAAATRYLALNPVRAGLAPHAQDWPWSSVHAHLAGRSEALTTVEPLLSRYPNFADLLALGPDDAAFDRLRRAESIGRPVGSAAFIAGLEAATARRLRPAKRGPRPAADDAAPAINLLSALSRNPATSTLRREAREQPTIALNPDFKDRRAERSPAHDFTFSNVRCQVWNRPTQAPAPGHQRATRRSRGNGSCPENGPRAPRALLVDGAFREGDASLSKMQTP